MCDSNCRGCWAYDNEYPLCNLDNSTECENVDRDLVEDGRMRSCSGHCEGCPLWAQHHPDEAAAAEENTSSEFKSVLDEVHTLSVPLTQTITISNDNQIGFWTFNPRENTTAYTISQEDMINMTLSNQDGKLFFKLFLSLLDYANERFETELKSFENVTKEQSNKNDKSFGTITQKASKISKENKLQKDKQPSFSRDNESRT